MKKIKILITFSILFLITGCFRDKLKNEFNLPIVTISNVLNQHLEDYVSVKEVKRYIILKNYDFYILRYNNHGFCNHFITAVSKNNNMFFFLNYPDMFSFHNYNTMIKNEKFMVPDEPQAALYLKFLSNLFIPEAVSLDEIPDAIEKGVLQSKPGILTLDDKYQKNISFDGNDYINAEFYSINKDTIMYNWQVRFKTDGTIVACKISMMALDAKYDIIDKVIIFEKVLDKSNENSDKK